MGRIQAAIRLLVAFPLYLVFGFLLAPVMFALAMLTFVVDIGLQLVHDGDGLQRGDSPFTTVFNFYTASFNWVVYGDSSGKGVSKWGRS